MKKVFTIISALLLSLSMFAQSPEKISYQAIVRNASDNLVTNTSVGMQISILQGSVTGTAAYTERHFPTTNTNGLISIEIGMGTIVSGDFSTIDWANDIYFIKTETDINGGANYTITGISQLLSVPYAFHAKSAESITGTINETDPEFNAWDKSSGISITESQITDLDHFANTDETDPIFGTSVANGISETDTANWNNKLDAELDGDSTNEIQMFSVSTTGDTLYLSAGNWVIIPGISEAQPNTITDYDGNVYQTVVIGNQEWMAENLSTTKYNNGTAIPNVIDNTAWSNLTTPSYCWYNNDSTTYANTYGALYNWYSVETGNLCPAGWHVPSDADWTILTDFLGGEEVAGGKLKEIGTKHWNDPNTGATNESGFTALPGSHRYEYGSYLYIGDYGMWWSSTENSEDYAWYRVLYKDYSYISRDGYETGKKAGFSVRCLQD